MSLTKDYITEGLLGQFLTERFRLKPICNRAMPGHRFKPDFRFDSHHLVIEFDGYRHYQQSSVIVEDEKKDYILIELNYSVIRLPYFVQLDERIVKLLFGSYITDMRPFNDFRHGFIDAKALLPADFCELGVAKFCADLERFHPVRAEIVASLNKAAEKLGDWRKVWPPSLYHSFGF